MESFECRVLLDALRVSSATAIELSALREPELARLMHDLPDLDLNQFQHVSIHAPSSLREYSEQQVIEALKPAINRKLPIVVHADIIQTPRIWNRLGRLMLIENMDKRKAAGRTWTELDSLFSSCPKARLCLDLAHARQVDPSLCETVIILMKYHNRLGQIHLSELDAKSKHEALSFAGVSATQSICNLIPPGIPVILEFKAPPQELDAHVRLALSIFGPSLVASSTPDYAS
jgi:hypothetical protein